MHECSPGLAASLPEAPRLLYGLSPRVVQAPGYWPDGVQLCGFWQPAPGLLDTPGAAPMALLEPWAEPASSDAVQVPAASGQVPADAGGLLDFPRAAPSKLLRSSVKPAALITRAEHACAGSGQARAEAGERLQGKPDSHGIRPSCCAASWANQQQMPPWRFELAALWPLPESLMPDSQGPSHTSGGLPSTARGLQPAPTRLDGGRKLVCFDFGSMAAVGLPGGEAHVVAAARGALERLGMHGVLLTGASHPAHAGCLITRLWGCRGAAKWPCFVEAEKQERCRFFNQAEAGESCQERWLPPTRYLWPGPLLWAAVPEFVANAAGLCGLPLRSTSELSRRCLLGSRWP